MSSTLVQDPHSELYDVAVVGSGATGGWAAKVLSEAGLKVVLLEAGRKVSSRECTEHMPAYKLEYRNHSPELARTRPIQKACYACTEYNYDWFVNDLENPYTTPEDKPFTWQRPSPTGNWSPTTTGSRSTSASADRRRDVPNCPTAGFCPPCP